MGLLRSRASKKRAKAEAKLTREKAALLRDQRRQARRDAQAARRAGQPTVGELLDDTDGLRVVLAGIESAAKTAIPS